MITMRTMATINFYRFGVNNMARGTLLQNRHKDINFFLIKQVKRHWISPTTCEAIRKKTLSLQDRIKTLTEKT